MSKEIDWSKAPEGATHYAPKREENCMWRAVFWRIEDGRGVEAWSVNDDDSLQYYEKPTWIASDIGRLIERPSFESWTGTGLPPVGTVCEFCDDMSDGSDWHSGLRQGMIVTVIAHFNTGFADVAAFTFMHDGSLQVEQADHLCFRPIRTQAKIEAEERESHVLAMLCYDALGGTRRGLAEALYDAGYRKTEAGK